MPKLHGRPPELEKPAHEYNALDISSNSIFGVGANPVKQGRPPELEHPGCVGCIGCGSSQAKKIK